MEDIPYAKREIDQLLNALDNKQEERHEVMTQRMDVFESNTSASLEEIKGLQRTTNGRVRWAEKMLWATGGFCICVTIVILPLLWSLIQAGKL